MFGQLLHPFKTEVSKHHSVTTTPVNQKRSQTEMLTYEMSGFRLSAAVWLCFQKNMHVYMQVCLYTSVPLKHLHMWL